MNARVMPVLIRREFWENRALWISPLVVVGMFLVICLMPGIDPGQVHVGGGRTVPQAEQIFQAFQLVFFGVLTAVMGFVVFFYLADCLYTERKDRSILFWKSLPVSDSATVFSKLLVAIVVVPLGVYVIALITNLLAFGILFARFHDNALVGPYLRWDTGDWLSLNLVLLVNTLVLIFWIAPLAAYQMFISAWAKGSVLVWTTLPPLILILGEGLIFKSWKIGMMLAQRLGTGFSARGRSVSGTLFERIDALGLFATPDFWIGIVIAAVFIYGAIRIRRYRDDT